MLLYKPGENDNGGNNGDDDDGEIGPLPDPYSP